MRGMHAAVSHATCNIRQATCEEVVVEKMQAGADALLRTDWAGGRWTDRPTAGAVRYRLHTLCLSCTEYGLHQTIPAHYV